MDQDVAFLNEQTVFETPDVPFPSNDIVGEPLNEPNVDTSSVPSKDAYEKFKNCVVDERFANHSLSIHSRDNRLFTLMPSQYSSFPQRLQPFETPLQKFQRLQQEIEQFSDELAQFEGQEYEYIEDGVQMKGLATGAEEMKQLLSQIESHIDLSKRVSDVPLQPKESLVRERLSRGEFQDLEQRITALETNSGLNCPRTTPLYAQVSAMNAQLEELNTVSLDKMGHRVELINRQFDIMAARRKESSALTRKEEVARLQTIYQKLQEAEELGSVLPTVIERLESLRGLHQQCANAGELLNSVVAAEANLTSAVSSNDALLKEVQGQLKETAATVTTNMALLEERMEKISKRLGQL